MAYPLLHTKCACQCNSLGHQLYISKLPVSSCDAGAQNNPFGSEHNAIPLVKVERERERAEKEKEKNKLLNANPRGDHLVVAYVPMLHL